MGPQYGTPGRLAYFEQRSTVDYIGVVQGIPVCFDAKECVADTFPLQNIHEHQIEFMGRFEKQEGIAFFLLYYSAKNILEELEPCKRRKKKLFIRNGIKAWKSCSVSGRD